MRFSDAIGRQVVSTTTAETLGRVEEFVVDPASRAVIAVRLKKAPAGDTLLWTDITAFGADAVTVAGVEKLIEPTEAVSALSGKDHRLVGKRVLATTGDEIGKLDDVEFDPESGVITALVLAGGDVAGVNLIGVGSYAVVVYAQ